MIVRVPWAPTVEQLEVSVRMTGLLRNLLDQTRTEARKARPRAGTEKFIKALETELALAERYLNWWAAHSDAQGIPVACVDYPEEPPTLRGVP